MPVRPLLLTMLQAGDGVLHQLCLTLPTTICIAINSNLALKDFKLLMLLRCLTLLAMMIDNRTTVLFSARVAKK